MTSVLQVVDSSGWIEVFTNGPQADRFLEVLDDETTLIVPAITIFEVFSGSFVNTARRLRGNIRLGSTAWMLTSRALQMLNSF